MSRITVEKWSAADTGAVSHPPVRSSPSPSDWRRSVKRISDVTIATLVIVISLPLMAVVALSIKLLDGGPVFFRQTRVGLHGALFTILKFRTMEINAESKLVLLAAQNETEHLFKIKRDPRVNPLGRILRRLSLDELPQLFNVLSGTMSLVGPRPHLAAEVARMSPEAQRRSDATPGMTGLWQISGRSDLDAAASIALDLRYIDTWSPQLDASILLGTIGAVITARGAH
jgi:lipopolysaccharide/colanic/teichoic acid biosynthesis glycosyltransferase